MSKQSKIKPVLVNEKFYIMTYISIFANGHVPSRLEMCQFLNLNTSRPNLEFTKEEINQAYKNRARIFHPDKLTFSKEIADLLMIDLRRARILLESNVVFNQEFFESNAADTSRWKNVRWEKLIPEMQRVFSDVLSNDIELNPFLDFESNLNTWIEKLGDEKYIWEVLNEFNLFIISTYRTFVLPLMLSSFSNNHLNFYSLAKSDLAITKVFSKLKETDLLFDMENGIKVLQEINQLLAQKNQLQDLITKIKNIYPNFSFDTENDEKVGNFLIRIELYNNILNLLVNQIEPSIELLGPKLSWELIFEVYFLTTFFTANNLVKYSLAFYDIASVIYMKKGKLAFSLIILPLFLLSLTLLPINLALYCLPKAISFFFNVLSTLYANLISLSSSLTKLLLWPFYQNYSAYETLIKLTQSTFDLTIRLSCYVVFTSLNTLVFYLTNSSMFADLLIYVNKEFDKMFGKVDPNALYNPPEQDDFLNQLKQQELNQQQIKKPESVRVSEKSMFAAQANTSTDTPSETRESMFDLN